MEAGPIPFPNGPIRDLRLLAAWRARLGTGILDCGSTQDRRLAKITRTKTIKNGRTKNMNSLIYLEE